MPFAWYCRSLGWIYCLNTKRPHHPAHSLREAVDKFVVRHEVVPVTVLIN